MEKFNNEDMGKLYGSSIQMQAMMYILDEDAWKDPNIVMGWLKLIVNNCEAIVDIVGRKVNTLQENPDEQEKTD